uniref:Uncharacterized protein n=1 Tax=Rhizophora mucronata TaxID=61149 RepID=A0A2P2PEK9_RHIMU
MITANYNVKQNENQRFFLLFMLLFCYSFVNLFYKLMIVYCS